MPPHTPALTCRAVSDATSAPDPAGRPLLTPAQERTLGLLRRSGDPVVFDPEVIAELKDTATEAMAHFGDRVGRDSLFVTKHTLGSVLDCEAQFLAPDEFSWSPARARGQVAHRAIQLLLHWRGEPVPIELVDEAIARLEDEERGLSDWLQQISEAERADLRGQAVDVVTKFLESFPPLDPRSRPVTESGTQWPIDGPVVLRGRADLSMGAPSGRESRKLIIDLKTGRALPRHREDLRFYALVETLSREVPPRRLASMYLDAAQPMVEDVTVGTLRSALRRTLDGINRIIELKVESRPPVKSVGAFCRWCTVLVECPDGQKYLASDTDER